MRKELYEIILFFHYLIQSYIKFSNKFSCPKLFKETIMKHQGMVIQIEAKKLLSLVQKLIIYLSTAGAICFSNLKSIP